MLITLLLNVPPWPKASGRAGIEPVHEVGAAAERAEAGAAADILAERRQVRDDPVTVCKPP